MTSPDTSVAETAVRAVRLELAWQKISQRQLAERLGWGQTYLWKRLARRSAMSLDDIDAIAAELQVSPFDLVKPRGEHN